MDLYLKITTGPRANDIFKIQPSITLGRSKADINLKDSKASTMHAKIIEEDGAFYYLDLNSTNGTTVDGNEIKKVKLTPGLIITIGSTNLEIATEFEIKKTSTVNLSEWREALFDYVRSMQANQKLVPITPFSRCIKVSIKSGFQTGTEWTLGYGPRTLGPMSADLCVLDESLENFCLKISQIGDDVVIDSLGEPFLINGNKKNTEILKDSLSLQIGDSLLEVRFLE